jgi:hypothetical protein
MKNLLLSLAFSTVTCPFHKSVSYAGGCGWLCMVGKYRLYYSNGYTQRDGRWHLEWLPEQFLEQEFDFSCLNGADED